MAKKAPGKKHPNNLYALYKKDGEGVKSQGKTCPKCGNGIFMAQHKNRTTCGKCNYTEFTKKENK